MNILLRGSWQTVNIGDIAHSPSIVKILKDNINDCNITLWASANISEEIKALIHSKYPDVKIVVGNIYGSDNSELLEAADKSDFMLHGSGAHLVAWRDIEDYIKYTGKKFGVLGITFNPDTIFAKNIKDEIRVLNKAEFVYFRDSKSVQYAKNAGVIAPVAEFGCDGVFCFDIINYEKAARTMEKYGLENNKFVCCIPRYRYTPYWEINADRPYVKDRDVYNKKMADQDNAPLRETIIKIIENTDLKVFICPEDETQVMLGKEILYDKLPENIKKRVVLKREFWLTDEAVGVYKNSCGLFGCEMHSPIMCIGQGIPAIVARWKEQTTKGYMWQDIGLGEWLFDFDKKEDRERFADACLMMVTNQNESKQKAEKARNVALSSYEGFIELIKQKL